MSRGGGGGFIFGTVVGTVMGTPFVGKPKKAGEPPAFTAVRLVVTRFSSGKPYHHWINCLFAGKRGEIMAKFASQGTRIFATGRLEQRRWVDKDKTHHLDYRLIVEDFQFLDRRNFNQEANIAADASNSARSARYRGSFQ